MTTKLIDNNQIQEAIKIAFENDAKLMDLYDTSVKVNGIEDIVKDVTRKVLTHQDRILWKGVFEKDKLIGYYVYNPFMLISFGVNIKYRKRKYLRKYFSIMREELGKGFVCHLHSRNIRGIKWLLKNKMEIVYSNTQITKLICNN